jgi:pSer/pThr/pTyr-binding forkhead associated (FHA) protein
MPILTLKYQEETIGEYTLLSGQTMSIGRRPENVVAIDNLAVSGRHAKVDPIDNEFIFTDLQSKNGSFINGQMVTTHKLQHGDVITIGKHTLEFSFGEGEDPVRNAGDDLYQTMVMDTSQHREMMRKARPSSPAPAPVPQAALSLVAGDRGEVAISKKLFKIGKGIENDLQVDGFWVGRTAITISQRPDGYSLSYVGGMSKPKVNGKAIRTTIRLKEFDMIELGRTKMQLVFRTKNTK